MVILIEYNLWIYLEFQKLEWIINCKVVNNIFCFLVWRFKCNFIKNLVVFWFVVRFMEGKCYIQLEYKVGNVQLEAKFVVNSDLMIEFILLENV